MTMKEICDLITKVYTKKGSDGSNQFKALSERVLFGAMYLKATLTASPELRMKNTAFSALRSLERIELYALSIRVVPQKFKLLSLFLGQKLFYYSK